MTEMLPRHGKTRSLGNLCIQLVLCGVSEATEVDKKGFTQATLTSVALTKEGEEVRVPLAFC